MRVAYFTAGKTGAGHLVRGLAIGRGLARIGSRASFRMFGPAIPFAIGARHDYESIPLDRDELRDPVRAKESALARGLRAFAPDLLVVDQYWAPLRFVLPLAGCEAWLVSRWTPPVWFTGPDAIVQWDPSQYARTIGVEPGFEHPAIREHIAPIVIANPDECRPPSALREWARAHGKRDAADDRPLHVVVQAGRPGECDALLAKAPAAGAAMIMLDLFDARALFPACEWLGGADAITCGAGYNAWWEAQWLGYAHKTTFHPFERLAGNDQRWRVAQSKGDAVGKVMSAHRENGGDVLARWISPR